MSAQDGGPAFPAPAGVHHITTQGMTLRDYFAAAALTGYRANHPGIGADIIAKECYKDADAMLAERAAQKEAQP